MGVAFFVGKGRNPLTRMPSRDALAQLGELLVRPLRIWSHHLVDEDMNFRERESTEEMVVARMPQGREHDDVVSPSPVAAFRADVVSTRRVVPHAAP